MTTADAIQDLGHLERAGSDTALTWHGHRLAIVSSPEATRTS
jgi:hypothetical protein